MTLSVALCTYNGEKFVAQQLDSILNQHVPVSEIVICDDCSTDGTLKILQSYAKQYPSLIKLHKNTANLGFIKNFENAILLCEGDIIFLSDQDDLWVPTKTQIMVDFFCSNPNAILLFTNAVLIDENNNRIDGFLWDKWGFTSEMQNLWKDNDQAFRYLVNGYNKVTGATVAFRAVLKNSALPFHMVDKFWHDGWLSLCASKLNGLLFIAEPLIQYRVHKGQAIGVRRKALSKSKRYSLLKRAKKVLSNLLWKA